MSSALQVQGDGLTDSHHMRHPNILFPGQDDHSLHVDRTSGIAVMDLGVCGHVKTFPVNEHVWLFVGLIPVCYNSSVYMFTKIHVGYRGEPDATFGAMEVSVTRR